VGDVIGTKTIAPQNYSILLGTLPYTTIATGGEFSALPNQVRHTINFNLDADAMSKAMGSPALSYSQSLPSLAGKKVALVYEPASPADQAVITAAATSGQVTLPAYLIRLMPVLKIEGVAVASGPVFTMGESHTLNVGVATPWYSQDRDYKITSGDLSIVGIDAAGVTSSLFNARTTQHDLSKGTDPDFTAEMFHQIILGWWGEKYAVNHVIGSTDHVVSYQLPSHGLAAAPVTIKYFFGIPRTATYKSRVLDVKEDFVTGAHINSDPVASRSFMLKVGQSGSYLESGIYDQAFSLMPGQSMSSITALKVANDMGVPIYTIDQSNAATAIPQIATDADTIMEFQNAIAAGKRVTAAQRDITVGTFSGMGYIIEDTVTGAAAYMISGGRNGNNSPAQAAVEPAKQTPGVLMIGAVMSALSEDAVVAAQFLRVLGMLVSPVGLMGLAIVAVIIVLVYLIYSSITQMALFRQDVVDRAQANPIVQAQGLPEDNCSLALPPRASSTFTQPGWVQCVYKCRMAPGQFIPRHLPFELGCPQPVPCAPGLLAPTGPRVPGVTPIDPAVAECTFLL
jgi:hypothetical protein